MSVLHVYELSDFHHILNNSLHTTETYKQCQRTGRRQDDTSFVLKTLEFITSQSLDHEVIYNLELTSLNKQNN